MNIYKGVSAWKVEIFENYKNLNSKKAWNFLDHFGIFEKELFIKIDTKERTSLNWSPKTYGHNTQKQGCKY